MGDQTTVGGGLAEPQIPWGLSSENGHLTQVLTITRVAVCGADRAAVEAEFAHHQAVIGRLVELGQRDGVLDDGGDGRWSW